jgi:hypothetical protein
LGTAKKGWQKTVQAQQASNALILSNEQRQDHSSSAKLSQELGVKKPKTSMELERDLRRLSTLQDKNRYAFITDPNHVIYMLIYICIYIGIDRYD